MATREELEKFQQRVWLYYRNNARSMPWRVPEPDGSFDAYKVLVSELMLQQTQVSRVVPKFEQFIVTFPTVLSLATASLSDVLRLWSGLGYNRRAKYLYDAAKVLVSKDILWTKEVLESCKGIGPNTAAAVVVYSYNQPLVFVETNIRTVFIHHFFEGTEQVHDKDILELVQLTLDVEAPRQWYWALMDYGAFLKASEGNAARRSKHYTKQTAFTGSRRQLRGDIVRKLTTGSVKISILKRELDDNRFDSVLHDLEKEGFIELSQDMVYLRTI